MSPTDRTPPRDASATPSDSEDEGREGRPADWRPEDPKTWGWEDTPREEWRPEAPETWREAALRAARERAEAERAEAEGPKDEGEQDPIPKETVAPRATRTLPGRPPTATQTVRSSRPRTSRPSSRSRSRSSSGRGRSVASRRRRRRRRSRGSRILRWSLLGLGLLVVAGVAVVGDAYYQIKQVADPLEGIRTNLAKARSALSHGRVPEGDPFAAATKIAEDAKAQVDDARPTYRLVAKLPILGRPMFAIQQQVTAANQWALAAAEVRDIVSDLLGEKALRGSAGGGGKGGEAPVFHDGKVNVKMIANLPPRLESLVGHLESADSAIRAIPEIPFYSRLSGVKGKALAESAQDLALARNALAASRLLPSFLGADRPKRYFLALQNNADLRGTGGAVLAYAMLVIDRGSLNLEQAGRIGELDDKIGGVNVKVPSPIYWYIRNAKVAPRLANGANYSPNMPLVGQAWANMVERVTGRPIDGAIALDPIAVSKAMGSRKIKIPSYPDPITSKTAVRVIENDQYRLPRFLQETFPGELIEKAWGIFRNPQPFVKTIQQLGEALRSKNIQIWTANQRQQALISKLRWSGELLRNPGDYLYLVDNKRVANKVDFYSRIGVDYHVTVGKTPAVESTAKITLINETPPGQTYRISGVGEEYELNRALMSLYVPERARFRSVDPDTVIPDYSPAGFTQHVEENFRVFAQTIDSRPGSPGTLIYRYSVPGTIQKTAEGRVYQLTIQHQPLLHPATVTVTVTLPKGASVESAPGWKVRGRVATLRTTLSHDVVTRIVF